MNGPPPLMAFEDFPVGLEIALGEWTPTEVEIVEFAREWDPQYIHIDPQAAETGPYGGLIASGWHTTAVWSRLYVDRVLNRAAPRGGGVIEELRWFVPTRPGDRLRGLVTVLESRPHDPRPGRGTLRIEGQMRNQRDEVAMRLRATGSVAHRGELG